MHLNTLSPARGSKRKKKLLGRGYGSGHGKQSTRGMKGQSSRSGSRKKPGFEGGQMPLIRRIPKRGFSNVKFQTEYNIVNLSQMEIKFSADTEVTPELLLESNIIKKRGLPVKVLGGGTLTKKLKIKANSFSKSAMQKITAAGGSYKQI